MSNVVHAVCLFPREEFHLLSELGNELWLSSHVSIGSRFLVDRVAQFERLFYSLRSEVKEFDDFVGYLSIGEVYVALAVGVDKYRERLRHANGVGNLNECLGSDPGSHKVFGDVTRRVRRASVHLAWVFAGERTTAVRAFASVGVHDYLTSRESRVTVRSADDELACGIDKEFERRVLFVDEFAVDRVQILDPWNEVLEDVLTNLLLCLFV